MIEYNFFNEEFRKTKIYQDFINNNRGSGNLKIRAYAAREALPLEGLHIEKLSLPTPITNDDNLIVPLSTKYEIYAEDSINSYVQDFFVNMYDGICVVQNIHFIPEGGIE